MATRREYTNALSSVAWRTKQIEKMQATCDRQANRYSPDKIQRLRKDIDELDRARAVAVLFLANSTADAIVFPIGPKPVEFLEEIGQSWPLPLSELSDRVRTGQVGGTYYALAIAAAVANDLTDSYPDGSETLSTLVNFVEDVGEKLRSVKGHLS
jgi:hypothetical protein